MNEKIDTKSLLARANIVDVIGRHVDLQKKGGEFYGVCPFHDDEKSSLQVNERKQIFKCFACADERVGGDAIQFLTLLGHTFHEACEEINGAPLDREINIDPGEAKKRDVSPAWIPAKQPWPEMPEGWKHVKHGVPSKVWQYVDPESNPIAYVARFDLDDGSKQVIPLMYATNGTQTQWRWLGHPVPRPLYNLDKLTKNPDAMVIVVEGEKTADAVSEHVSSKQYVVTTWIGGANGIKNANWDPLKGRNIILWPDHDTQQKYGANHAKSGEIKPWHEQPGNHAMIEISKLVDAESIQWINVPDDLPNKWDAADRDDWNTGSMLGFIMGNIGPIPKIEPDEIESEIVDDFHRDEIESGAEFAEKHGLSTKKIDRSNPPLPPKKKDPENTIGKHTGDHFRFLGYDTDENSRLVYYFFSYDAKSVIKLSPSAMSKANLMMLAPINYWEDKFRGMGRQRINIDAAQQYLMQTSHKIGPFREKWIRGRGAWIDDDVLVIHTGEQLLINNNRVPLKQHKSKFVYQIGEDLGMGVDHPLSSVDAGKLIDKMKWLEWERGVNAYLLAGWCVIAPFCGVLDWRPHIWITGPAGSGKSWVMDNIVKRMMGDVAVVVQGKTTEAGVRGMLQSDARPVLFDESDVDGYSDRERIQSVLALARSSSYRDGGVIGKGTQSGSAKSFTIRSCFAFSSIGVHVNQQSDRSRFTMLGLKSFEKLKTKEDFAKFELEYKEIFTVDFVRSLQARTMRLLPVILENSHTFADAASHLIGNRRIGDQIGGMLAGAYSLKNKNAITYDDALEWCKKRDWDEERGMEQTKDEFQLITAITSHVVRMETDHGYLERTIGELIMFAGGKQDDTAFYKDHAADRIRRIGIMVRDDSFLIANNSPGFKEILKNTPWQRGHNKVLERLPGAEKMEPRLFVPGLNSRSVALPFELLTGSAEPPENLKTTKDDDLPF